MFLWFDFFFFFLTFQQLQTVLTLSFFLFLWGQKCEPLANLTQERVLKKNRSITSPLFGKKKYPLTSWHPIWNLVGITMLCWKGLLLSLEPSLRLSLFWFEDLKKMLLITDIAFLCMLPATQSHSLQTEKQDNMVSAFPVPYLEYLQCQGSSSSI